MNIQLRDPSKLDFVLGLLKSDTDPNIACNCVTILFYLISPELKESLGKNQKIKEILIGYKNSSDTRLKNLSTIFLEDLEKI